MIRERSSGETISYLQSIFSKFSDTPALDAQVLLAEITSQKRAWILAHPEISLTMEQHWALEHAVTRLKKGEPLPYVLGHWDFYGLNFTINANTLIPRPETELLVEQAIHWLRAHPGQRRAADVGTGSGCIAVSLAVQIDDLQIIASDLSPEALQVARENAQKHNITEHIEFVQADLLPANLQTCDLICANLPYIPTEALAALGIFGKEPTLALDGGPDGFSVIRRLLPQAVRILAPTGLLLLEIEASLGDAALSLVSEYFPKNQISLLPDLTGRDRLIRIETFAE